MFCPKCGAQALSEEQRFCKSCGTNLQAVNEALERGDSKTTVLGIDVGGLVKSVKESVDVESIVKTVKESVGEVTVNQDSRKSQTRGKNAHRKRHRASRSEDSADSNNRWLEYEETKTKIAELKAQREKLRTPKPKEWMAYSWQHNLKYGLMSLFSGVGLGIFLYYLGKMGIESGLVDELIAKSNANITGLHQLARLLWLVAVIPVLKGFGQIFYAAFFAESMATLAERFTPQALELSEAAGAAGGEKFLFSQPSGASGKETAPVDTSPIFDETSAPPPSVTETTTRTLEEARIKRGQYEQGAR